MLHRCTDIGFGLLLTPRFLPEAGCDRAGVALPDPF